MATYFDNLSMSFADVSKEPGVNTAEFLEASKGLVGIFNLLGATSFSVVIKDMNGNIAKIQSRLDKDPVNSATLEGMLAEEAKGNDKTGTEGLLWLLRGLEFVRIALQRSNADSAEELSKSFNEAYAVTLKPVHQKMNFLTRNVVTTAFTLAMSFCPERANFYAQLGSPPEKVQQQGEVWLNGLEQIVTRMKALYEEKGYGKVLL